MLFAKDYNDAFEFVRVMCNILLVSFFYENMIAKPKVKVIS